ncbi:clostripain-related cysteine peptidase [Bacteroides sp. CR5/BHMF/2]|nr:clostripain-related cysteine peptidase [Bacteroides sp. CR5/BHMF/2]
MLPNRTILFYMAGDNSLGDETQEKIDALAAAWNVGGNSHLLVYQDRGEEYMPRLLEVKTGADGKGTVEVLEEYKDENSASAGVFARVLNDMLRYCPGSDYGLVVFSHSSGWLPTGTFAQPRSVVTDRDTEFDLIDFARAIPNGQFRFIVFESCLMAGAEVAYELKDKTGYILASSAEILSPGFMPCMAGCLRNSIKPHPTSPGLPVSITSTVTGSPATTVRLR